MASFGWLALCLLGLVQGAWSQNSLDCNFEKNYCSWQNTGSPLEWNRFVGATPTPNTGPSGDNTLNGNGFYVYMEASGATGGEYASLVSPSISGGGCLEFYYYMDGADIGQLNVLSESSSGVNTLWTMVGDQGAQWIQAQVRIPANNDGLKVRIDAVRGGLSSLADIAIDDIKYYDDPFRCPDPSTTVTVASTTAADTVVTTTAQPPVSSPLPTYDPTGSFDCDFEVDYCLWNYIGSELEFLRITGGTPTPNTGPKGDHTYGSDGTYAYMEASGPRPGQNASLVSPDTVGNGCFEFYYHMNGSNMGELNLYADPNSGVETQMLWTKSGNQGDQWLRARVFIPYNAGGLNVRLEAVRGDGGSAGDIAIDDIKYYIDPRVCAVNAGPSPITTASPTSIPGVTTAGPATAGPSTVEVSTTTQKPTVAPTQALDCVFDVDFCQWQHENISTLEYRLWEGATFTPNTGPSGDHTAGNGDGWFAYMEASNTKPGDSASLISPNFFGLGCFEFYYHMNGTDIDKLEVYAINSPSGEEALLWSRTGSQGVDWKKASFYVPYNPDGVKLRVTASVGNGIYGDIAIDDTTFSANTVC